MYIKPKKRKNTKTKCIAIFLVINLLKCRRFAIYVYGTRSKFYIEPVALVQFICDKSTLLATSADDTV